MEDKGHGGEDVMGATGKQSVVEAEAISSSFPSCGIHAASSLRCLSIGKEFTLIKQVDSHDTVLLVNE